MTGYVMVPAGYQSDIAVLQGPRLLSGIQEGPGLEGHRVTWQEPPDVTVNALLAQLRLVRLRGRGGAGFPFARKVSAAVEAGRKRELVVNAAESEPASAKDSALMIAAPHLVLDGAQIVARALKVRTVRIVIPGERPAVERAVRSAVAERGDLRYEIHLTAGGYVSGQARAVLELLEGRANLPVTAWDPEAVAGFRGRPTVLSNAETFAQVAAVCALGGATYSRAGTAQEPGTGLLTVAGDGPGGVVLEVPHGEPLAVVLHRCGYDPHVPVLVGGYHGSWLAPEAVTQCRMSRENLARFGATPGPGVVLPLDRTSCPVMLTADIVEYLAGQSARRCGPCIFGLGALSDAANELADGTNPRAAARMAEVAGLVTERGACSHPDGSARLVRSLLRAFPEEVAAHRRGRCLIAAPPAAVTATPLPGQVSPPFDTQLSAPLGVVKRG